MNRVVVTGMGIYSCIGKNLEQVRDSLFYGRSGIVLDQARKEFGYRSGLTGNLERPELKCVLDRRARLMIGEQGEYAYMSTLEALRMAGIDQEYLDHHETGIIFGNDSTAKATTEANDIIRAKKNTFLPAQALSFRP